MPRSYTLGETVSFLLHNLEGVFQFLAQHWGNQYLHCWWNTSLFLQTCTIRSISTMDFFMTPCKQFNLSLSSRHGGSLEEISRFASGFHLASHFFPSVFVFPAVPNEFETSPKGHWDIQTYSRMLQGECNHC